MDESAAGRSRKLRPYLLGVTALGLIAILGAAWWLGFLTPEPDPVSITEAVETVQTEEAAQTAEEDSPGVTSVAVPVTSIDGEWTVVTGEATFIGYRADSDVGEAVGRSPGVTGSLTATESEIVAVNIVGDMAQLGSDSRVRDDHLGSEGLETKTFPTSTFVLIEPIAIDDIPEPGVERTFSAVGELTVKDIARPVTIELQAVVVDDKFVVAGSSPIQLVDYEATIGSTTEAIMEFSLVFARAS